MIVFDFFQEKSSHPKFYQPVADMMRAVHWSAVREEDLRPFVNALEQELESCKPRPGHGAHIDHHLGADGYIILESPMVDDVIARLHFHSVRRYLSWSIPENRFIEADALPSE